MNGLILKILILIGSIFPSSTLIFNMTSVSSPDTSIQLGEPFQLMCTVNSDYEWCSFRHNNHTCDFEWKRSLWNVTVLECGHYQGRIRFLGSYDSHECGVEITEAREEDDGEWVCAIEEYAWGRSRHFNPELVHAMDVSVEFSGCESGWVRSGDSCYRIFPSISTVQVDAQGVCLAHNANLVTVETRLENNFLMNLLNTARETGLLSSGQDVWLGARRTGKMSPFAWKSLYAGPGQLMDYSDWGDLLGNPGEALDTYYGHPAHCAQMFRNSNPQWRWGTTSCDGHDMDNGIVCEKIVEGSSQPEDYYGSGMEPADEIVNGGSWLNSSHEILPQSQNLIQEQQKGVEYLRLTSSGLANLAQAHRMGLYQLQALDGNNTRPVYKQVEGDQHIYLGPDDSWRVGPNAESLEDTGLKTLRIQPVPPSPPPDGWQFYGDDWIADSTIQLEPTTPEYFKLIPKHSNSTAMIIQPQRFGVYKLVQQNGSSFPVYAKLGEHEEFLYVLDSHWMVGTTLFQHSNSGVKNSEFLPRGSTPRVPPTEGWMYWDSKRWITDQNIQFLPTNPAWSSWGEWSSCSRLCGGGNRTRERTCTLGQFLLNICVGDSLESSECNSEDCPESLQNGGDCTGYSIHNLPSPRIMVLGPPKVGKSTLSNFLLGVDPASPDAPFLVSSTKASDTGISWRSGPWLGTGECFTVIDTPSPAIVGGRDHQHAASLMKFIKDEVKSVDVFLLIFNAEHSILTPAAVAQLQLYEDVLGRKWWENVITQMSHWSHSTRDVRLRRRKHLNETVMHNRLNQKYKRLLNVSVQEIPTTFIDPVLPVFVDEPEYYDYDIDEREMNKYLTHSQNLLDFAKNMKSFMCEDSCKSPEGYYTGQPLIQVNHVSAYPGEYVGIQCQIFTGHHKENSHNITWTRDGDVIYRKLTAPNGNVISDGNIIPTNFTFEVNNEFLVGSEDIFFSYLNVTLSSNSTGEYRCENGIPSDKNFVSVVQRTGTWSQWGDWSSCSQTCGGGNQTRTRECMTQHQHQCPGEGVQNKICNTFQCVSLYVKLVGGKGPFEGNVIVVNSEGYKGPVCDDDWSTYDANVVCRQLGYPQGAVEATTESKFGRVDSHMAMDSVSCNGDEEHIQHCSYRIVEDCGATEGAGVICKTDVISSSVMSNDASKWGDTFAYDGKISVESEGFFQSKNETYPWIQIRLPTRFPLMVAQVNLHNRVDSNGDRLKNIEVRAGMDPVGSGFSGSQIQENSVCGHFAGPGDDGGEIIVKCDSPIQANFITVQKLETGILHINELEVNPTYLVGGNTSNEGNVVVNRHGKYGPICDDTWSLTQANIVCKELGFSGGAEAATRNSRFGNVSMEYVMDDVWCEGEETRIDDCTHLTTHDCGPTEVAGVICKDDEGQSRTEGSWGPWTSCSATCGGGTQTRKKTCESKTLCPRVKTVTEQQACNTHICPRGNTTDWRVPCKNPCRTKSCKASKRKIKSMLDTSIDPCYDFHKFACGGQKFSYNRRQKLDQPFEYLVKNAPPEFQFIKNFYKSCIDAIKPDKVKDGLNEEFSIKAKAFAADGKWPVIVGSEWEQEVHGWFGHGWTWYDFAGHVLANDYYVGSMQYMKDIYSWNEYDEIFLTSAFFSPSIDVTTNRKRFMEKGDSSSRIYIVPMTVPKFLKDKDRVKIEKYRKIMKDRVKQLGADEEMAEIDMERVLSLEIELAEMTKVRYNREGKWKEVSLTELSQLVPSIPWLQYINKAFNSSGVKIERGATVLIPNEAVMTRIGKWIDTVSYRDQANLIMWRMFSKFTANFLYDENWNLDKDIFITEERGFGPPGPPGSRSDCIQEGKFQASGHDIGNLTVLDSLRECMDNCKSFNGCVAITYNRKLKVCTFHSALDKSKIYHKSDSVFAIVACDEEKRSKNCLQQINTFFPVVKDDLYIALNLDKSEVYDIKQLFEEIKAEFAQLIHENDWMDTKTKGYALEKLKEMKAHIGETHLKHQNMNELTKLITDDKYIENIIVIGNYFYKTAIQDMKKPKDLFSKESVNNAYYADYANEIQINTGLLKDFGYNIDMPRPLIYGGCVGSTLGHELTHGFDNNGKLKGKYGNIFSWWEESAEKAFKDRTQCIIDQYNNFKITHNGEDHSTNGTICLGENIADNGGVKLGYRAFMKYLETHTEKCLPTLDFTPKQLFWIGWAQDWCAFDYSNMGLTHETRDPHSSPPWRVNTVFSNMPQFAQDFNCPVGAKLNPETRCTVW